MQLEEVCFQIKGVSIQWEKFCEWVNTNLLVIKKDIYIKNRDHISRVYPLTDA